MSDLHVELLYTTDCPHWETVRADLHRVLSEGAMETPIQLVHVSSQDDAEFLDFHGSPSVRINGEDVVPLHRGSHPHLGCRLYVQPSGPLSGRIPIDVLREAVRRHRQGRFDDFRRAEAAQHAAALEQPRDADAATGGPPTKDTGEPRSDG